MTKNFHQPSKAESTSTPDFEKQKKLREEFYRFVYALALRDVFAMRPDEGDDDGLLDFFEGSMTLSRIRSSINFAFLEFRIACIVIKALTGFTKFGAAIGKLVRRGT